MTMTRQHFKLIAEALAASKPEPHWDANKMAQWTVTVNRFVEAFQADNIRFKSSRFLRACGVEN